MQTCISDINCIFLNESYSPVWFVLNVASEWFIWLDTWTENWFHLFYYWASNGSISVWCFFFIVKLEGEFGARGFVCAYSLLCGWNVSSDFVGLFSCRLFWNDVTTFPHRIAPPFPLMSHHMSRHMRKYVCVYDL